MKRRYLLLWAAMLVLAVALTATGRSRRPATVEPAAAPAAAVLDLAIGIADGRVSPAMTAVPKGRHVRLRVENRGAGPARLALAGYEDRLELPTLAPGGVWTGDFLADRPGDDFAWLLDGQPAGRLAVTGSHLIEGHR